MRSSASPASPTLIEIARGGASPKSIFEAVIASFAGTKSPLRVERTLAQSLGKHPARVHADKCASPFTS